ncbi:AraC family transcriptional regulator [Ktedonosporobacter rubrisoli]|uniref:AraC family transcriptional regulator n=1 Tax=Ktedonosporobacter rubrisoli TaxID=2509675 RepID=A0A4P6JIM7_KTERU|nr:AraC family transcriptional regulator [Ktedonosporobacter rubrisoli]QBD74918.1 AraC family transcriptional regulator [Ktedonosporobacter rubrisoli]
MIEKHSKASGAGLERLCTQDWMQSTETEYGIEFFEAWFQRSAYQKHRHDTYALCLTTTGVQAFTYRGATQISLPGQVVVLHPDELHDGYAATQEGYGYRQLYVEPALIFEALQAMRPRHCSLPFVRTPVVMNRKLSAAIIAAFQGTREPLAIDSIIVQLAEGLLEADPSCQQIAQPRHLDVVALKRARQYLDTQKTRVVHSRELEAITGLTRYELARQFRQMCGTSPYRYLLMRRLNLAREQLVQGRPLVDVALEAGFADQAHFSRMFKATFGFTPALYRTLSI